MSACRLEEDALMKIAPEKVRFIKLGEGGEWEQSCLRDNTIRLGYHSPYHRAALAGKWNVVRAFWLKQRNGDEGATTRDINQIRDFYELKETDLWITFHQRKLYWCRAAKDVVELEDKSRIRKVIGSWSSEDLHGKPLRIENIDGRITKVQGFRGTICSIELPEYLIRKINGLSIEDVETARHALASLSAALEELIKGLWWHDFELLIDLIFSKAGWQRFSVLGKTEKDLDLEVYSPTTNRKAFVQIKSKTTAEEVESSVKAFRGYDQFDEMYLLFHTCHTPLPDMSGQSRPVHIWGLRRIADMVISAGLVEWLINKRA
jgi:hypothetical protein